MGKRLPKSELLAEIYRERELLIELLETVPARTFTKTGMNSADWCIKDVLTHLVDWETRTILWINNGQAGGKPETPGDGFGWHQTRQLNALIQKRHSRKSVKTVLVEFDQVHDQTLAVIATLTDHQLTTIGAFEWTGKSWTVSDYVLANTANHYRWARNKIRKWLQSQD